MTSPRSRFEPALRAITVAGLAVDAGVHLALAPTQPPAGPDGGLSQVTLFYAEAVVAVLVAILVLATGSRLAYAFAALVSASALGAVLLYRWVDVGPIGPLPDMYEPSWYPVKVVTTIAEAVALFAAASGVALARARAEAPAESERAAVH